MHGDQQFPFGLAPALRNHAAHGMALNANFLGILVGGVLVVDHSLFDFECGRARFFGR